MQRRNAFTLIELLVVVSIIALLLAILMPALNRARDQAKAAVCLTNLKQLGLAVHMYADDYNEFVPRDVDRLNWILVFMPYVGKQSDKLNDYTEVEVYECPAFPTRGVGLPVNPDFPNGVPNSLQTVDYVINAFTIVDGVSTTGPTKLNIFERPAQTIYLADNEDGKWRPVIRNRPELIQASHFNVIDCWESSHLPISDRETMDNNGRRVARTRHRREGCNNLFVDSHVEWIYFDDNDLDYWNRYLKN